MGSLEDRVHAELHYMVGTSIKKAILAEPYLHYHSMFHKRICDNIRNMAKGSLGGCCLIKSVDIRGDFSKLQNEQMVIEMKYFLTFDPSDGYGYELYFRMTYFREEFEEWIFPSDYFKNIPVLKE